MIKILIISSLIKNNLKINFIGTPDMIFLVNLDINLLLIAHRQRKMVMAILVAEMVGNLENGI